jgi:hypothetical protein
MTRSVSDGPTRLFSLKRSQPHPWSHSRASIYVHFIQIDAAMQVGTNVCGFGKLLS